MSTDLQTENTSGQAPFSREQLHQDITNIFLLEARNLRHLVGYEAKFAEAPFHSLTWTGDMMDAAESPTALGLSFENVKDTDFAGAIEDQYDFAFHALTWSRSEPLKWDTIHTWMAAYLFTLAKSDYAAEWQSEGWYAVVESIRRLVRVTEQAISRCILEGEEPFFSQVSGVSQDDGAPTAGELSIRQLAMLAGMEEMSLRSAISRKTHPVLETRKQDRRTYVEAAVAKEWLKAKRSYIPVSSPYSLKDVDLKVTSFRDVFHLNTMLRERHDSLGEDNIAVKEAMRRVLDKFRIDSLSDLQSEHLGNEEFMTAVAQVLDLPASLMVMRAKEAKLKTEIQYRQYEITMLQIEMNRDDA